MAAALLEIGRLQVERAQLIEVCRAQACEFVEPCADLNVLPHLREGCAIESIKRERLAVLQDDSGACHPVAALAFDQVADDVEGTPGVGAFILMGPFFGEVAEEGVERGWSAG